MVRKGGPVQLPPEPHAFDPTAPDLVDQPDTRVFVPDADYVSGENLLRGPRVAVDEPDVAEPDAPGVGHRHVHPRLDATVVVALHERDGEVRQRLEKQFDLAPFGPARIADRVHQVAEKDDPVRVGAVHQREQSLATGLGPTIEFDAVLGREGAFDPRVDVCNDQRSFAVTVRDGRRFVWHRFDDCHQMGLSSPSPGS